MDPLITGGKGPQIGQPAPAFSLPDLHGSLYQFEPALPPGRILMFNFWSAECPWAEAADQVLLGYLAGWGVQVGLWTIASNANEPPELLAQTASQRGLPVLLHDASQQAASLYGAQTTPHLFVIDPAGILRYQGALDDITFRQRSATRFYLREAVDALLAGRLPEPAQTAPYGCTVVYHAG